MIMDRVSLSANPNSKWVYNEVLAQLNEAFFSAAGVILGLASTLPITLRSSDTCEYNAGHANRVQMIVISFFMVLVMVFRVLPLSVFKSLNYARNKRVAHNVFASELYV